MLFDVSHLGAAGVEHVLELATRPVIATHSSARAFRDHHRNLTDAQLKGIATGGGVVCVNFFAGFLDEAEYTVERLVDHILHVAEVAGIDHVGIGPDFIAEVEHDLWPAWCDDYTVEGIDIRSCRAGAGRSAAACRSSPPRWSQRGLDADAVGKVLGGNVVRLMRAELGRPAR